MAELPPSTREVARRIGVTETALRKAAAKGRIEREADGQWDVAKTRRRMMETADPVRSPLAGAVGAGTAQANMSADATPFARLKVAQLALKFYGWNSHGRLRFSFHCYTAMDDVERIATAVSRA